MESPTQGHFLYPNRLIPQLGPDLKGLLEQRLLNHSIINKRFQLSQQTFFHALRTVSLWASNVTQLNSSYQNSVGVGIRHGTISNFCSISISIISKIWFSKSISISKFFKKLLQYQNQYQYQNFPTLNIKINIKNFQNPESISKSISISSKY